MTPDDRGAGGAGRGADDRGAGSAGRGGAEPSPHPSSAGDRDAPRAPHRFLNPEGLLPGRGFSHVAVPADGQVVFVAGQTAHDADGVVVGDDLAAQCDRALANLVVALDAAGARPEHVVAMQLFVTDVAAYRNSTGPIGAAWRRHLGRHYPTVSLFGVAELADPDAMVEVVATAVVPS